VSQLSFSETIEYCLLPRVYETETLSPKTTVQKVVAVAVATYRFVTR